MSRIAVIGGGITGLSAAHRINEISPEIQVDLFEASGQVGGVLKTEFVDPLLVEHSADMFTTMDRAAIDLCERIGFADQLIGTNSENQRAFIAQGNELVPVPRGLNLMTPSDLDAIRETTLLSDAGKARFLAEEKTEPRKDQPDESLESFAIRRFGEEAYQKIIQPLVGGIYTADPTRLSLRATLPRYLDMESKYGSIINASRQQSKRRSQSPTALKNSQTSGARYNIFVAPQRGMGTLISAIKKRLTNTRLFTGQTIQRLAKDKSDQWLVETGAGDSEIYDSVLMTCPADIAASLIEPAEPHLASELRQIEYASSAIVVHAFAREDIQHSLDGFGFVVPMSENRKILAGSFSSVKFNGRAPEDMVLTRTFIGGGCQPELLNHTDPELCQIARQELGELIGCGGSPRFEKVVRWNHSMPQYHLGHLDLVAAIEDKVGSIPGLELAGKSFRGVGIPACVHSGESAAQRLSEEINR